MCRIDRAEALGYLGYAGQPLDDQLQQRFDAAVEACERDLVPRSIWASFRIDQATLQDTAVVLHGSSLVLEGRSIAQHLEGAVEAVLLACTLGAKSEQELRRRTALSPADALMYSAAASALVEAAANEAEAAIVAEAATRGLRANFRYSPGYGDFPLTVQPAFLAALDATRRIGLTATETNLLVPAKSITAVIGLFDGEPPHGGRSSCDACQLRASCKLRTQGRTCHG